jgi:hypothetical protein
VKLALTPPLNHFWNVAFTVEPRGLTTGSMPAGERTVSIDFDLLDHNVVVRTSLKETRALALVPRGVADFYSELMTVLASLGIDVTINDHPVELMEEAIPFSEDRLHASYDPGPVERWLAALQSSARAAEEFRAGFLGKASPVLFYWGTFDLCASRFSGRLSPPRRGADPITREAFSHECFECGFWAGDSRLPEPAYYAFVSPEPTGLSSAQIVPAGARWEPALSELILPYEAVRASADPEGMVLDFFQSAYEAGADLAGWDRASLDAPTRVEPAERPPTMH